MLTIKRVGQLIIGLALTYSVAAQGTVEVSFSTGPTQNQTDIAIVISDANQLGPKVTAIDQASGGELTRQLAQISNFKENPNGVVLYGVAPYQRVLVKWLNPDAGSTAPDWQNLGGKMLAWLQQHDTKGDLTVVVDVPSITQNQLALLGLGAKLRGYSFSQYKRAENQPDNLHISLVHDAAPQASSLYESDFQHLAQGVYLARNMSSEPGKSLYPALFVERVRKLFKGVDNVEIDVLDVRDMEKHNMGALLGVGQGSIHEPRLLVIKYNGAEDDGAPIALVGKGITFDTGGISLKPNNGMWAMKSDLSGAAAVAGTMLAVAKRAAKVNVVGLMPLAENMPAEDAIRPGDVLQTMHGTSIEIISTDAEGRLILADAVTYAQQKYTPTMLLNIATLTGSALRALSDEYAAVITRDFALSQEMMAVGEQAGEHVWPLPLHPNHFKQIGSDIADIKNSGAGNPGASIGAAVVGTFIDESLPWVHLDIAGVDYLTESTDVTPKGAAGWGVRFMDQLLRNKEAK